MKDTEDIRKKEKKLSRDHWMCRIQKYTFGIDAPTYYMGYCPFFWMTWLSLLVCPIVFLGKTFTKLVTVPANPVIKYFDVREKQRREELIKTPLEPNYNIILDVYTAFKDEDFFLDCDNEKITIENCSRYILGGHLVTSERIRLWFIQNPNWRKTHLEQARVEFEKRQVELKRQEEAAYAKRKRDEERTRKLAAAASMCGRGLFKLIIPSLILLAVTFGYYGIIKLCSLITLPVAVGVVNAMIACVAVFFAIKILLDFLATFIFTEKFKDKIAVVLSYFFADDGLLFKIIDKIKTAWLFAKDTVALTYKAECPLIQWGDETGKITKRENSKYSN
jgi:hypothetical protein